MHALSCFLQLVMAASITFCCRLFQTSMRRSVSSSTLFMTFIHSLLHNTKDFIIHYIEVWAVWCQRSGPVKSGVSCCSCLMVSLHDEMEHCLVERQTYRLQDAWSLAVSAERVKYRSKTGRLLSFQGRQRSTQSPWQLSHFWHNSGNHNGYLQFEAKFMIFRILKFPNTRWVVD